MTALAAAPRAALALLRTSEAALCSAALTAVSVAALTIYDMCKAVDKAMVIGDIRVIEKIKE